MDRFDLLTIILDFCFLLFMIVSILQIRTQNKINKHAENMFRSLGNQVFGPLDENDK